MSLIDASTSDTKIEVDSNINLLDSSYIGAKADLSKLQSQIELQLNQQIADATVQVNKLLELLGCTNPEDIEHSLEELRAKLQQYNKFLSLFNDQSLINNITAAFETEDIKLKKMVREHNTQELSKLIKEIYELLDDNEKYTREALNDGNVTGQMINMIKDYFGKDLKEHWEKSATNTKQGTYIAIPPFGDLQITTDVYVSNMNIFGNAGKYKTWGELCDAVAKTIISKGHEKRKKIEAIAQALGIDYNMITASQITSNSSAQAQFSFWYDEQELAIPEANRSKNITMQEQYEKWGYGPAMQNASDNIAQRIYELGKDRFNKETDMPSDLEDIYYSTIKEMITVDKVMFMIGNNINNIPGLLGEIQAGLYIKIWQKDAKFMADWVGPRTSDTNAFRQQGGAKLGKQYSADWWIGGINNNGFGIQVKNYDDFTIDFGNFDWDDLAITLGKLNISVDVNQLIDFIKNAFFMQRFNIEYKWENGLPTRKSNINFEPERKNIVKLASQATYILNLCATLFTHAQTTAGTLDQVNANTLYIINGLMTTAVDVLTRVRDQTRDISLTGLRAGMALPGASDIIKEKYTVDDQQDIVSYILNEGPNLYMSKTYSKARGSFNFNSVKLY